MKRFAPREFAFLCSPLVVLGIGVIAARALYRPTPAPMLTLSLGCTSSPCVSTSQIHDYGWMGHITDEEEKPRKVGYRTALYGSGPKQPRVLLDSSSTPLPVFLTRTLAPSSGGALPPVHWNEQKVSFGRSLNAYQIPPGIKDLEWQLEVVAVPVNSSTPSDPSDVYQYPLSSDTLQSWARTSGALYVQKRFTAQLTKQEQDPILNRPTNKQLSTTTQGNVNVTTELKGNRNRLFRCLEAFDGKVHRLLWKDIVPSPAGSKSLANAYFMKEYWGTSSGGAGIWFALPTWYTSQNALIFDLRSVPASWGKITLQIEAVADPQVSRSAKPDNQSCDKATIQQLKAQGWVYGTRTVVIRDEATRQAAKKKFMSEFMRNYHRPAE